MSQEEDARIFRIYAIVRLAGLATFLLGLAIAFSDLVRPGGWPSVGGLLAIVGVLDAVIAPPLVRRALEKK